MIGAFQAGVMASKWWMPNEISTALWLDAADSTTITQSSGVVSQWNDKSGNVRHYAQSNNSYRPTNNATTLNGYPVVSFDGSDDYLELENTNIAQNVSEFSIIAVANFAEHGATDRNIFFVTTNSTFTRCLLQNTYITNKYRVGGRQLDSDSFASCDSNTLRSNEIVLLSGHLSYATAVATIYRNAVLENTNSSFQTAGNTSDTSSTYSSIGGTRVASYISGYIAEIVCYLTTDTTTRQKLEGYLAHKWGLAAKLPSDHPYKTQPPRV